MTSDTQMEQDVHSQKGIDWIFVAVGAALVMLFYFTVTNHIDLYPLNNLSEAGSQWNSTLAGWIQFVIFIALLLTRRWLAVFTGLVISIVWLGLQFRQWYLPYLFDVGSTEWFVEHGYDETVKILPSIEGHTVTPDLQHNLLQLLSVLVIVAAALALRQVSKRSRRTEGRDS